MYSNLINKQLQIKYLSMLVVLNDAKVEYETNAKAASDKFSQTMYYTGAENCQNRIDMINQFLKDLAILDTLPAEKS